MQISTARENIKPQDQHSDGTDGIGFLQFYGHSPALDLLGADPQLAAFGPAAVGVTVGSYKAENKQAWEEDGDWHLLAGGDDDRPEEPEPAPLPEEEGQTINVLLVGNADIRHVVKTIAKKHASTPKRKVRFFIHESRHEVLARHLLFLQILNNKAISVRDRAETFLSIYANCLVRERDSTYVSEIADELVELVTDNSSHPLTDLVDLSHLKYKDRDMLQDVFKSWNKNVPFDMEKLRDQRCRGYYRERYDYRKNLMDMDYSTCVKEVAGIINWFHFKEFGFTGVAYETRLATYSTPNRTFSAYLEARDSTTGDSVEARGFWGDIINSPYHAFSTTTNHQDRARLFKISGSQYRHTETDIAEFNMTAYVSEMETGEPLHLPPEKPSEQDFGAASPLEELLPAFGVQEVEEKAKDTAAEPRPRGRRKPRKTDWPPLVPAFEDVQVVLLAGDVRDLLKKTRYQKLFHRAFVGALAFYPFLEELGLTGGGDASFKKTDGGEPRRIVRAPHLDHADLLGSRRADSSIAGVMAEGGQVVFETMKYQAHFDGSTKLAFRHRLAQIGLLSGWRLQDARHSVPQMERDMKEKQARDQEKYASDFVRFVA